MACPYFMFRFEGPQSGETAYVISDVALELTNWQPPPGRRSKVESQQLISIGGGSRPLRLDQPPPKPIGSHLRGQLGRQKATDLTSDTHRTAPPPPAALITGPPLLPLISNDDDGNKYVLSLLATRQSDGEAFDMTAFVSSPGRI